MKRVEGQIPFGDELHSSLISRRCPECLAGIGGFHHLGCSVEQCPKCRGQLLYCICELAEKSRAVTKDIWWTRIPKGAQDTVAE
jgi:hypothetical protein